MAFSEQMPAWFDLTHEPVVGMASTVSTGTDRFSASGWENFGEMEMSREIGVAPHRVVDCYEDMYPEMASNWNGEGAVQSEYVHETQKEPGFMDLSYQTMLPLAEIEADAVPHSPDISTLTTTSPTMKEPNSSVVKFKTTAAADLAINKHESSAVGAGSTKRYKCSFCPYSSDRKEICKRHAMTHTGEKLFQCFVCYKQFSRTDHCKKHLNRMHSDTPYDLQKIKKSKAQHVNRDDARDLNKTTTAQVPFYPVSVVHQNQSSPVNVTTAYPSYFSGGAKRKKRKNYGITLPGEE